MKVAIFGKKFDSSFVPYCNSLLQQLHKAGVEVLIYERFANFLIEIGCIERNDSLCTYNDSHNKLAADLMISIGGDGTFLEAVSYIQNSEVPVIGVNSGRLGFLADVAKEDIYQALDYILNNDFTCNQRTLLELNTEKNEFGSLNFGLNELAIQKRDTTSMLNLNIYIDGEFLSTFWADGIIVATPTGSTAYSLSLGGPIIHPNSQCFVITPIAPHNLTVRPIVVPNSSEISFEIEGRDQDFLVSLDSRSEVFKCGQRITVYKAPFTVNIVDLPNITYNHTLHNKLMWGVDKRN